ncbi:unnamed protein product [Soboliphyme baturini]|uniref:Hexosyltransferase n=1 Tax=Soboliphyme baturini TaxID=241478 RepID=A0A183IVE3_9BILA|nr:unnamed protein product [Soboliphyme baturini]
MMFTIFRNFRGRYFRREKFVFLFCILILVCCQLFGSLTNIYCECLQLLQVFSCQSENLLPNDFNFSIRAVREPSPCQNLMIDYVAFTPILPSDLSRRSFIRNTWAKQLLNNEKSKFFFVLAMEKDVELKQSELSSNNDLLILDVVEHYHNLTLKIFGAFDWISRKCRQAKFVVRADSDIVLSKAALERFIKRHRHARDSIFGYCRSFDCVMRVPFSKHCISPKLYAKPIFPSYCFGFSYVISYDVIPKILGAWPLKQYFNLDDVFVTGIIPEMIGGIHRIDQRNLFDYTIYFDTRGCADEPVASAAYGSTKANLLRWHNFNSQCHFSNAT